MSALPNPLQELAEKLALDITALFFPSDKVLENAGEVYELLTASIGTLLQAERAAQQLADAAICDKLADNHGDSSNSERCHLADGDAIRAHISTKSASALSAVVQRELERDRENFVIRGVVERKSFDQICNERDELERETEKLRRRSPILELDLYIEELRNISAVCERPREDGEKCIQCCERERIIRRLEEITRGTAK